jgi:Predicted integral membrane protein
MSNQAHPVIIPPVFPPLPRERRWNRDLRPAHALQWIKQGWMDLRAQALLSLFYGMLVFLISVAIVGGLFVSGLDSVLFPALAGFMVVGPILAIGLYEKSRRIAAGERVSLFQMIFVQPRSGAQILFTGVLLCLLMLLWMRAAVIIYALFFGLRPFPGLAHIAPMLFTTMTGWAMLIVGSIVGALFAAFSFAISAFSIPMLLDRRVDALTAMGTSVALVWHNLPAMLAWGAMVLGLFLFSLATGLIGLIVVFPVLGHGTWHAYDAVSSDRAR